MKKGFNDLENFLEQLFFYSLAKNLSLKCLLLFYNEVFIIQKGCRSSWRRIILQDIKFARGV